MSEIGLGVSVVVASYRRPAHLRRCLDGLGHQRVPPEEIVVVRRRDDDATAAVVAESNGGSVAEAVVHEPGVVAGLEAGARASSGGIVAFVDDDAVARPDWIERLVERFSDPAVGAVGGRDVLHTPERLVALTDDVGRITSWGKVIGNHHRGGGNTRDVDVLKAVNMAFRREALAFPRGLRGEGAQVNFEVAMCLWARRRGWRILFDPAIVVDHFPGPRFGADRRGRPERSAVRDSAYNSVASVVSLEPRLLRRRALYGLLVGNIGAPGLARAAIGAARGEQEAVRRLLPSLAGQADALADHVRRRRLCLVPLAADALTAEPRKLVVTVPWGERLGGAENMLLSFLRHADRRRFRPLVVFLQRGPFESEVRALGFETAVVEAGRLREPLKFVHAVRSLAALLRRERPDLILNWMAKTQLYGAPAAALARTADRVLWWQHLTPDGHWLDRIATLLPSCAIGCSSRASAEAQARLGPRRPTFAVHPGVDVRSACPSPDVAGLRQRLGIPDGRAVVGIVGRLQPWKGQDRVIEAVALLRRRGHDVHGLVVGGDAHRLAPDYGRSLLRLAQKLGVRDEIEFAGHVEDPAPYLAVMDVLVNASIGEPFGIVLLEAMAAGVPVVAVDAGGPVEIVEAGRSGLLIASGTPTEIADAVERILTDEELARRLRASGRARVQRLFTARRMAERLQAALEGVAAR
ncbi:MAG TPA: glycosyltransferase [Gaiellaceae bacterium]|nr:glycosyltransferase [Gaiellaceae bacterium]